MESMTTLSALHRAVEENRLNDFKVLLNLGFDINEEGQNGRTPLIVSVINQYQDFIDYLLDNNVSVNTLDTIPFSALNYAIESGNIVTVKKLIDHKADVNVSLNTTTPLIQSISKNQKEVFDLLIDSGALIDIPAKSGNFPIHEAAQQKDSIYYIEFLTNRGFYVDFPSLYKRQTPLMCAVDAKNKNVIKWILNHGCDIFLRDHDGNSAFSHAMMAMELDIADEFVKRGVDLNETDSSGNTIVCKLLKKQFVDGVYFLIDRGAMANAYDQDQNTLLIIGIEMKNFNLCYYLLDKGAIPDLPGALQLHPIHHAAKIKDEEAIKLIQKLLELGEDVNIEDQFRDTPLGYTNWKQDVPSFNFMQTNNQNHKVHSNTLDMHSRLKNRPVNISSEAVQRNPVAHYIKSIGGRDYKWEQEYEIEITNYVTKIKSVKSDIQNQKSLIKRMELRNTTMPESHTDFEINRHKNHLRDLKLQKLSLYNEVDKINLKMWYYNNL
ncbi:hypothetical protein TVAG_184260 [Trichomonas vaginalis G3]|uniref:Uncharacterized protein n=1 Tax=Trichomonas vaginalis (strain ATCC PRA-98 / G3) TaxID=412133 RepID=A2E9W2_TRIV3|nr:spectrin binding [Trichomonas vaginalis G3]EAY10524.1 hypothetical protein TVAG_184260 [Trichomonas vaginalis G3]KAI5551960.1 spectrin binding [Trichomonas vaginalis G3]|eukprot:XP_001322747.1 hypothetical protein [Trichomonas vaginalis G3]